MRLIQTLVFLQKSHFFLTGNLGEYDAKIKKNIDDAIDIAEAQREAKNSGQSFITSTLNDLVIFLRTTSDPSLIGAADTLPFLEVVITGALKGAKNGYRHGNLVDAVIGIIGGLASGGTTGFQSTGAKIGYETLKGE